jgi:hypothetical protein
MRQNRNVAQTPDSAFVAVGDETRRRHGRTSVVAVVVACVALGLSVAALVRTFNGGGQETQTGVSTPATANQVAIPNVVGVTQPTAENILTAADLTYTVTYAPSAITHAQPGTVASITPPAGSKVPTHTVIGLTISDSTG